MKVRAKLNAGNWQDLGSRLLQGCADYDKRVLFVIDELTHFLKTITAGG